MDLIFSIVAETNVSTGFLVVALLCIFLQAVYILVGLFGRGPKYKLDRSDTPSSDPQQFLKVVACLTDAAVSHCSNLEVLTNGDHFYEAELAAIEAAQQNINLEAYIFQDGKIARRYLDALTRKAQQGLAVRLLLDGLGSAGMTEKILKPFTEAGGKVAFYHPLRFGSIPKYNNRTHRELMVVDGRTAFIGGAGVADHWYLSQKGNARWRDTMVRFTGETVQHLQATFAENWLEADGELLAGDEFFPKSSLGAGCESLVINSVPSPGGSTRARVLFQLLLSSARQSIHITTPYFLPDHGVCRELIRAQQRGVAVKVLVPGRHNDHMLTRSSSRLAYGRLLQHGVRIFEYQPSMLHAKILVIDGEWSVVGSTNFDNRSFGINDEVNLAVRDKNFAERLEADFQSDMTHAREIDYAQWKRRPLLERGPELLGWILERQQ